MPATKQIRIVVKHPLLTRLGTNLLVLALAISIFYALDPSNTNWGYWEVKALKYAPIIASAASALCFLIGVRGIPVTTPGLSVVAFSLACIAGGVFTLMTQGAALMETFIGRGLCVVVVIPAYVVSFLPSERRYFSKAIVPIILTIAIVMIPLLAAWRLGYRVVNVRHIYHISAVYFCSAAALTLASRQVLVRTVGSFAFALGAILTVKLTGFGFGAIIAAMHWRVAIARRVRRATQMLANQRLFASAVVLGVGIASIAVAVTFQEHMPDGTRVVRMQTYAERVQRFLEDPIFGSFFSGSPVVLVGYNRIPSHSDFLDILGFGGVVGGALFYVPALVCMLHGLRSMVTNTQTRDRLIYVATVSVVSFLWESAVNPILGDPRFITLYWISIGVLLADHAVTTRKAAYRFATAPASAVFSPHSGSTQAPYPAAHHPPFPVRVHSRR